MVQRSGSEPARSRVWAFLFGVAATLAILASGALGSIYLGLWSTDTAGGPSPLEVRLAGSALSASLERHAPVVSSPVPPSTETIDSGMRIFAGNCAGCHGGFAQPRAPFGLGFYPPAPQFRSNPPRRSPAQLFYLVKHGVRRTGMTAWGSVLSDDDIWRAVLFVARLDSLPARLDSIWRRGGRR